jgi:hypothetical protein
VSPMMWKSLLEERSRWGSDRGQSRISGDIGI